MWPDGVAAAPHNRQVPLAAKGPRKSQTQPISSPVLEQPGPMGQKPSQKHNKLFLSPNSEFSSSVFLL